MLNFSTTDFAVDAPDSARVNADTSTLCDIFANSHIRAKDTIEGVITINQNTRCKLTKRGSDTCHDGGGDVELVLADCVVVSSDIIKPLFFRVILKYSQGNHDVHELRCFVCLPCASILYQVFIYNLPQSSISKQKVTIMVYKCVGFINFLLRILNKYLLIIYIIAGTSHDLTL